MSSLRERIDELPTKSAVWIRRGEVKALLDGLITWAEKNCTDRIKLISGEYADSWEKYVKVIDILKAVGEKEVHCSEEDG